VRDMNQTGGCAYLDGRCIGSDLRWARALPPGSGLNKNRSPGKSAGRTEAPQTVYAVFCVRTPCSTRGRRGPLQTGEAAFRRNEDQAHPKLPADPVGFPKEIQDSQEPEWAHLVHSFRKPR
jgi:hypothetical protein